jgi:hypothetical protein
MRPPSLKITRAKWTGDLTQAAEGLLCECEALSSNPIHTNTHTKECLPSMCKTLSSISLPNTKKKKRKEKKERKKQVQIYPRD